MKKQFFYLPELATESKLRFSDHDLADESRTNLFQIRFIPSLLLPSIREYFSTNLRIFISGNISPRNFSQRAYLESKNALEI